MTDADFKDGELLILPEGEQPKCPQWIVRPTQTWHEAGFRMETIRYEVSTPEYATVYVAVCPSCGAQIAWQTRGQKAWRERHKT